MEAPVIVRQTGSDEGEKPLVLVIWRNDEAGLGATLGTVMRGIQLASYIGALPHVDTKNFWTSYSGAKGDGEEPRWDLWNGLFQPVSQVTDDDLRQGKHRVLMMNGNHPKVEGSKALNAYREVWSKISFLPSTNEYLANSCSPLKLGPTTLGVHFRSGDMRTAPGHPTPPSFGQVRLAITKQLDRGGFDRVFLATQSESDVAKFKSFLGDRLVHHLNTRATNRREAKLQPFASSTRSFASSGELGAKLALESLRDMFSLSLCGGVIGGTSNMILLAEVMRGQDFPTKEIISNGRNPTSRRMAYLNWHLRARAPRSIGGFSAGK
jgi:hypothetical protein